jgi:class 3 adenylate cyclase/tetratricopeptide (TPR) repeat protein
MLPGWAGVEKQADEELRKVTVLFSDISGYTAMTEHLGPEDTKAITSRIFSEAAAIASKYEGRLDRLVGDCALILFGIPHLHEDDALRAITAALEIHAFVDSLNSPDLVARVGRSLAMHSGVNTGTVVAGQTDFAAGTESVVGDAVNIASRLKDAAEPGQILIGADTQALAAPHLECEPVSPLHLKGVTDPVSVFRVLALKTKPQHIPPRGHHGIRSPLVGRQEAVAAFTRCLERLEAGLGSIVIVLGEAGVGKSRLIAEMTRHIAGRSESLSGAPTSAICLEGHSLTLGQTISYLPFQEILRQYAGISEHDSEQQAWDKLAHSVGDLLDGDAAEVLPALASLLGMELKEEFAQAARHLDSEAMGHRIYLAARRFFERAALRKRLVLILEDFHWIDESSALLVEHLLPLVERAPLLICCASRIDPESPVARLRETAAAHHAPYHMEIALSPLSGEHSAQLARNLLRVDELEPAVQELIVGKSEGNPFFMEEVTRTLIDAGALARDPATGNWKPTARIGAIAIPDTVQGVIMSRVDRLEEGVKQAMKIAAVIGRTFHRSVLQAVAESSGFLSGQDMTVLDRHLATLQAIELIRERQRAPVQQYTFTHALVRDAVYESVLARKRRELHAHVGIAIERLFADRLEEFYGLLAYHYAQAEAWEKAQKYLFAAGDQAGRVAANAEALSHYRNAMAAYARIFGDRWDPVERAALERKIGQALYHRGEHEEAREYLLRALDLLGFSFPKGNQGIILAILRELMIQVGHRIAAPFSKGIQPRAVSKRVEEAMSDFEFICSMYSASQPLLATLAAFHSLNQAEREGSVEHRILGWAAFGYFCMHLGLRKGTSFYTAKALTASESSADIRATAYASYCRAIYLHSSGDWAGAIENHRRASAAFKQMGNHWLMGACATVPVHIRHYSGDSRSALTELRELLPVIRDCGDSQALAVVLDGLASILRLSTGPIKEALEYALESVSLSRSVSNLTHAEDVTGELGFIYLRMGRLDEALAVLEESVRYIKGNHISGLNATRPIDALALASLMAVERAPTEEKKKWLKKAWQACRDALRQGRFDRAGLACALRFRARFEWLRGRPRAAHRFWRKGLAEASRLGAVYETGMIELEMGDRLRDARLVREAETILDKAGAILDRDVASGVLQSLLTA